MTEEVQKVLAASDDLANVDSNQSRGTAYYNAAWEALEEVTESLEEPIRSVIEERLDHMRKTFKVNMKPRTYRIVCIHMCRFLLTEGVR